MDMPVSGKPLLPGDGLHHDNEQKSESGECSLDRRDSGRGRSFSCEDDNLQNDQGHRTSPDLNINSGTENTVFSDDHSNFENSQQLPIRCPTCHNVFSHREIETNAAESANIEGPVSVSSNSDRSNPKLKKQDHVDHSFLTMNSDSIAHSIENGRLLNHTSTNSIGSPAISLQSGDLSCEDNLQANNLVTNLSQNSHELSISKNSSFPHSVHHCGLHENYSDSSPSKVAAQNGFRSHISTSLPETPVFLSSVAALPISLKNLVPRNVMDSLSREMVREKSKIKHLETENIELKKVNSDIPLLKTQADFWRQKSEEEENKFQELFECHETLKVQFERSQKVIENLRKMLESERARFQRELNEREEKFERSQRMIEDLREMLKSERTRSEELEDKNKTLQEENDFLHDFPQVFEDEPDFEGLNIRGEVSPSLQHQRQNDRMQDEAGQTEVKQICSDSTSTDDFPE